MSAHRGVLRERMGSLLTALALACGLMITAALCFAAQVKPWGDTATPALKFDTLQGGRFDTAGLNGKIIVLNFWAVWCEPCREELPALARLATSLQGQPVALLLVNTGDSNTAITKFFNKAPTTLRSVRLPAEAAEFRFATLPSTVIFDAQGRPRWVINGIVDAEGEPVRSLVAKLQTEARRPTAAPAAKPAPAAAEKPRTGAAATVAPAATVATVAAATPTGGQAKPCCPAITPRYTFATKARLIRI
jgi:thiol-disulfide isomerase/thioredoxin